MVERIVIYDIYDFCFFLIVMLCVCVCYGFFVCVD